jgi:hypothetical protein
MRNSTCNQLKKGKKTIRKIKKFEALVTDWEAEIVQCLK